MSAKFEIRKSTDGQYYFNLKAANGEVVLSSEQYKTKTNALAGIDSVKKNAAKDAQYERKKSTSDQPYFVLKATNGETVGKSQMYSSDAAMEKGIESVKANAAGAIVSDLSDVK